MLRTLGRAHTIDDIRRSRDACREAGIAVMLDLIFGAPGETRDSIRAAVEAVRALDADAAGIAFGLRLYRGTPLADRLAPRGGEPADGVAGASDELIEPAFYVEPALGDDVGGWLADLVADDPRFFYLGAPAGPDDPAGDGIASYNYNANAPLERAIAAGERGAYWDTLRRIRAPAVRRAGDGGKRCGPYSSV